MIHVYFLLCQSVMDSREAVSSPLSTSSVFPSTPRSAIRPLSAAYRSSGSDHQVTFDLSQSPTRCSDVKKSTCVFIQVVADRLTPRKDTSIVSKAMEYMFGW